MPHEIQIVVNLSLEEVGAPMSSEWAAELAREIRAKRELTRLSQEAIVSDQKKVERNAAPKWKKICNLVKQLATDLNEEMSEQVVTIEMASANNELVVKMADSPRMASSLQFNPHDSSLRVSFHGGDLVLAVNSRDELVWKSNITNDVWDDEGVAQKSIEYAWRRSNK
ncbi:MAG TPA: hypothetical protein VGL91_03975 [Acidobacteriota bacterium]|jgi:hypothetical protein